MADVIDGLAGIVPGSALDGLRQRRLQARTQSQATHDALFSPVDAADMAVAERWAVAAFVAGLIGDPAAREFYARHAGEQAGAIAAEASTAAAKGPYGAYPNGPLTAENVPGPSYQPTDTVLGPRLIAAFKHVHMLVFHPRDASGAAMQALLDAGWSETGIVTLSQIVAFLSYQIRVAAGLRSLAAHPPAEAAS